jgi:hypothetical protein
MQQLNLPGYDFRLEEKDGKTRIFDRVRKKMVVLSPEEWVRQHILLYLIREKHYPESLITVEASLKVARRPKRTDLVVYNRNLKPLLIVECKAPHVKITAEVFDQIVRYNMTLQVRYLLVTNGLEHFCCTLDYTDSSYAFLPGIPEYKDLE